MPVEGSKKKWFPSALKPRQRLLGIGMGGVGADQEAGVCIGGHGEKICAMANRASIRPGLPLFDYDLARQDQIAINALQPRREVRPPAGLRAFWRRWRRQQSDNLAAFADPHRLALIDPGENAGEVMPQFS